MGIIPSFRLSIRFFFSPLDDCVKSKRILRQWAFSPFSRKFFRSYRVIDLTSFQLDGATYHASQRTSGGGVGRNIAEGLSKIHGNVHLISRIGIDQVCLHFIIWFFSRKRKLIFLVRFHSNRTVNFYWIYCPNIVDWPSNEMKYIQLQIVWWFLIKLAIVNCYWPTWIFTKPLHPMW